MSIAERAIIHQRPRRVNHVALIGHWFEVENGVWVGSTSGIYLGRVEAVDGVFRSLDDTNAFVADFADLKDALACLERPHRSTAQQRGDTLNQ